MEEDQEKEEDQEEEDGGADFDGTTLVGRWVMKFFKEENSWFLGQITGASPPKPEEDGWVFHVSFEDGDKGDYPRT
jgi:hypothetical protein